MKRTALVIGALSALTLLGGCAIDEDYDGGGGYYGSYGYYDGGYGPDYYPGGYGYGYAYIPRGHGGGYGYRGPDRDHDRGRDYRRDGGQGQPAPGQPVPGQPAPGQPFGQPRDGGGRGAWNGGDRGGWNGNGVSQAARDADRAAHPQSFNADGERITRGNFWRQNQSQGGMTLQPQQAAPTPPPSGDGGRGFRGRRDN